MSIVLTELIERLSLEPIEENLFRGKSQDLGLRQLFGGQVLGQALSAACQTIDDDRQPHSLHGYFLRPGDATMPVVYQVDRVRDGRSFSTRRVTAIQKGQPIFTCIASFQPREQGLEHQAIMPDVPGPEDLVSEIEKASTGKQVFSERVRSRIMDDNPIEIRHVNPTPPMTPKSSPPVKHTWFRAARKLPDNPAIHKYILAYASDFDLLTTSMLPHGVSIWQNFMQVASLDHAIWFHSNVRADEWLLYSMESPWADNARGLSRGSIFTQDGRLVASTAQEGLIRVREDWRA